MASEAQRSGSVFDILYADARRLSSLLSQFSDDGLVTEVVRAAEETSATKVGVSVKVISADGTETGRQSTTRRIDPQWLLPLLFLDQAQDMVQRDITAAAIGSLVLTQGRLVVTDLRILQELWKAPAMKKFILAQMKKAETDAAQSNRQDRRAATKKAAGANDADLVLDMLPMMPHSPQVNIVTENYAVWATIDPGSLVGTVEDIMLKHGAKVAGGWSMIGILDARPWEQREDGDYEEWLSFDDKLHIGMFTDNVWKVATDLAQHVRTALGRPYLSYAVTPLIIFREIETQPGA